MKLGLVARADNSGLGIQTWEFYRHIHPDKTLVVNISKLNGNEIFPERYPEKATFVDGFPNAGTIEEFLADLDCVFIAEAPYNYYLYERAKQLGVKTAVQYNYEFFDWFAHPDYPKPDMLIAPSRWHYADVQKWCDEQGVKHTYLHCPVNRELLPQRQIKQAKIFLHTAGKSAAHDRNGTKTVIEAAKFLQSDAQILIHFQGEQGLAHQATMTTADYQALLAEHNQKNNVEIVIKELPNYQDVYSMGDVLLLPRRYGGNCLPLNEALSIGMPAIMTDINPNSDFLPASWLVPAHVVGQFTPRTVVDIYGSDPEALAAKIDEFAFMDESQMYFENVRAGNLAQSIDWRTMAPKYHETLEALCAPS